MYNGIGLRTVRGSGTNGFVQRNRSYVPPPPPQQLTHAQQRDVSMRAQLQITKKANGEMLEHERKRRIEIKVAEFEEQLRSRNFSEEEIEQKCADARIALTEQMKHTADEINLRDSHQASAAKEKENARLRAAFGIREDRPAGSAFAAMNDKGKKGEEKDAPTEDKPLRLPRSYLDRTIEKREGEEEDEDNPRRKRQRSRSPQREGQAQERERERGGREREDGDRRDERGDRGDRGDYGDRDRFRRSDDRDRRDRRDERSYDNRDRRDRRDVDEDRYRPRERSRSPFDGQPKMRDDGRDEGEPRSVIVAEPEPEQDQEETKKETEKGEEVAKEKSDDKKREREREREKDKEKEKDKDKGKGKDKSSSRSKKRSKRSDSSSDSSSSDSDSDSSSSSDSDDDRHKKDSKRKRSPSQD